MTDLTAPLATPLALAELDRKAAGYAQASKSDATRRAYALALRAFAAWAAALGLRSLPALPADVARYLTERASGGAAVASLALALTAISRAHVAAGFPSPRLDPKLREVWKGICNVHGKAPKQARALPPDQLRRMSRAGQGMGGTRDRALLLLGFAGAFRRAELVALDVGDVRDDSDGLIVTVRRSKTDQQGQGRQVGIPFGSEPVTCPVRALRAWLAASGITEGAIFRGVTKGGRLTEHRLDGRDVARMVKRAAKRARVPASALSGHSLRSGLVTAAAKAGKSVKAIMDQTGHKSAAMVMRYVRNATLFEDNAASGIGL